MIKIKLPKILCKKCDHKWTARKEKIYICPKCHCTKYLKLEDLEEVIDITLKGVKK